MSRLIENADLEVALGKFGGDRVEAFRGARHHFRQASEAALVAAFMQPGLIEFTTLAEEWRDLRDELDSTAESLGYRNWVEVRV